MKTKFAIGTYNPDGTPKTKKSKRRNMTYRKKLTKYRQAKLNKELLIVFSIWIISIPIVALFQYKNEIKIDGPADKVSAVYATAEREEVEVAVADTSISELPLREISYYSELDSCHYPTDKGCLTASGKIAEVGMVATNLYPFGTKIEIDGIEYTVEDRISKRLAHRIDIFTGYGKRAHTKAINEGIKHLPIKIIK